MDTSTRPLLVLMSILGDDARTRVHRRRHQPGGTGLERTIGTGIRAATYRTARQLISMSAASKVRAPKGIPDPLAVANTGEAIPIGRAGAAGCAGTGESGRNGRVLGAIDARAAVELALIGTTMDSAAERIGDPCSGAIAEEEGNRVVALVILIVDRRLVAGRFIVVGTSPVVAEATLCDVIVLRVSIGVRADDGEEPATSCARLGVVVRAVVLPSPVVPREDPLFVLPVLPCDPSPVAAPVIPVMELVTVRAVEVTGAVA